MVSSVTQSVAFDHHLEAQRYADTVSDSRARAALRVIHNMILESAGWDLRVLPERYQPTATLDVLLLYRAVARLFVAWTERPRNLPDSPGTRDRLALLDEAESLVHATTTERVRVGLSNFISILLASPIPSGQTVDVLFCCRLVSVLLSFPGLLDRILSGEAEKDAVYHWDD
jgi:hypothetical protein